MFLCLCWKEWKNETALFTKETWERKELASKMNEESKKRKRWPFILGIALILLLILIMFFYFATASPQKPRAGTEIQNPIKSLTNEEAVLQFNEKYINYLIFAIGGWKLHNPPLSDETPKIKAIVDGEIYFSEIVNGEIKTERKEIENEDIIIRTTKQEIVNVIMSLNMKNYIKQSVEEGKTSLELREGYTTLFSKGYLNIYKDVTGKSFTGSVVRIFVQD